MENSSEIELLEVIGTERGRLDPVIGASFEGWYQRHAKRTLREIETVIAARSGGKDVGVSMLKNLDSTTGYVYYIAVIPDYRGKKIGSKLIDYSLDYFKGRGVKVVFASLVQEHDEANILFNSRGFRKTSFGEVAKKYGRLHAVNMYRKMLVVSGEVVVFKEMSRNLD